MGLIAYLGLLLGERGKAAEALRGGLPRSWEALGLFGALHWDRELARQMAPVHRLRGLACSAIAKSLESDDLALLCDDGRVAVVHLTWSRETIDDWPSYAFLDGIGDFLLALHAEQEAGRDNAPDDAIPCPLCDADWQAGEAGKDCPCCDGHALSRPCPYCGGQCSAVWKRAIADSIDQEEAVWIGQCGWFAQRPE